MHADKTDPYKWKGATQPFAQKISKQNVNNEITVITKSRIINDYSGTTKTQ